MPNKRDTYKYHFKRGNKIVHTGITNDPKRREQEHQQEPGWSKGYIKRVGNAVTHACCPQVGERTTGSRKTDKK